MKPTSRCLILFVVILSSGSPAIAQTQRTPDATRILKNMAAMYSGLTSYQDEGILITTHDEPTGGTIEKMPFKTHFKRPNLFRFEWTDFRISKLGRQYMIWFDGNDAYKYWEPDRYEKEKSLSMAVGGASGITRGAVKTVADLLLPADFSSSLNTLANVSLAGEEVFEGTRCYRIKAVHFDEHYDIWVGKTDLLLRKIRREEKSGDGLSIEEEIRRKIQVNQSIGDVVFNYKPSIPLQQAEEFDNKDLDKLLNPGPPVWTEFRSEAGRFTVLLPNKPTSQSTTVDIPQGRFELHAFAASHGSDLYIVSYTDLPQNLLPGNDVDGFFDGMRSQLIQQVQGKLASESRISVDGYAGRDVRVHIFGGEYRFRLILVGNRVYTLTVMQREKTPEESEEILKKFFPSFKLNPTAKPVAALF